MRSDLCNGRTNLHPGPARCQDEKSPARHGRSRGIRGRDARGGIRTHDLLLRRQALYPAELRTQKLWHDAESRVLRLNR
jgi:hypothetical protein